MMIGRHHPRAAIEIWAEDEARIGLVPIVRRVWAERGKRPVAQSHRRYEWMYVYGFVRPTTGRVEWLLLPTTNTELFALALASFAKAVRVGARKHVVLIVDQAGWHMSKKLKVQRGLHLVPLPSYSPELQPAERLWPLLREAAANDPIATLSALERRLVQRCRQLRSQRKVIRRNTLFAWWADAANAERRGAAP